MPTVIARKQVREIVSCNFYDTTDESRWRFRISILPASVWYLNMRQVDEGIKDIVREMYKTDVRGIKLDKLL